MIKRILKYLLFFILILSLGLIYSFSSAKNKQHKIVGLSIQFEEGNNHFLTYGIVNKLLIQNEDSIQNQAKTVIDLYDLESKVLNNPYVAEASVYLTVDGVLKTSIKQREPIARIVDANQDYYIDKEGVVFPLSPIYSARVLLVSGVKTEGEIHEMLPLLHAILADEFLKKEVIGIEKMPSNEFTFAVRSGDYKIEFGDLSEMKVKFKKIKAFYNKTYTDQSIHEYKKINVKYHNQVVCTK